MAYCGPRGIPLSTFLGAQPPGVWADADRSAALEWQSWESRRCSSCGTHPEDWDESKGGDRFAFKAALHECTGCVRIDMVSKTAEAQRPGVHIRLV